MSDKNSGTILHLANAIFTVKHGGGNIMMWECFYPAAGKGELVCRNTEMPAAIYGEIVQSAPTPRQR